MSSGDPAIACTSCPACRPALLQPPRCRYARGRCGARAAHHKAGPHTCWVLVVLYTVAWDVPWPPEQAEAPPQECRAACGRRFQGLATAIRCRVSCCYCDHCLAAAGEEQRPSLTAQQGCGRSLGWRLQPFYAGIIVFCIAIAKLPSCHGLIAARCHCCLEAGCTPSLPTLASTLAPAAKHLAAAPDPRLLGLRAAPTPAALLLAHSAGDA